MDDGDHELIENAERDEALLVIVEAIVFVSIGGPFKDSVGIDKQCCSIFSLRFASLHVNRIGSLYIRYAYASRCHGRRRSRGGLPIFGKRKLIW